MKRPTRVAPRFNGLQCLQGMPNVERPYRCLALARDEEVGQT